MKPTVFAYMLTKYLTNYLPQQQNMSNNTLLAYRDAFKLLIRFSETHKFIPSNKLTIEQIDRNFVTEFLDWLESEQHCCISTRNHRLAIIRSFFKYVQYERPEMIYRCQEILGIKSKKYNKTSVDYLDVDTLKKIFSVPDTSDKFGLRDAVLLELIYDTGARVSEIVKLRPSDFQFRKISTVKIVGKGNKTRISAISSSLAENIKLYLDCWGFDTSKNYNEPLFKNHQGMQLSRAGAAYILKKYANNVIDISSRKISPHILRHSKAMHMLESGVNLIYIRDHLGHSSVKTTEIYARANPKLKAEALEKISGELLPNGQASWLQNDSLLSFLDTLGK